MVGTKLLHALENQGYFNYVKHLDLPEIGVRHSCLAEDLRGYQVIERKISTYLKKVPWTSVICGRTLTVRKCSLKRRYNDE